MSNRVEIVENNQKVVLEVTRVAFYAQGKVAECKTLDGTAMYYLFFYKNEFLTGKSATKVKRGRFIETAMKQGIILDAPHPMIKLLFPTHQTFPLISFKKLLKKLEQQKTPQEIALILSFFNDFIRTEPLTKVIEKQFFEYRRNGQLLFAYQILQIAKHMNQSEWAKEIANRIEYQKYGKRYSQTHETLVELDPIFAELDSYANRHQEPILSTIYRNSNRTLDLLVLELEDFSTYPTAEKYQKLTTLLQSHFTQNDYVSTLLKLHTNVIFSQLEQDLLFLLLDRQDYQQLFELLTNHSTSLSQGQQEKLKAYLTSNDVLSNLIKNFEKSNHILISLFKSEPHTLEVVLRQCVISLLKNHNISYVNQWLNPLRQEHLPLPILSKIEKMAAIHDDPDRQSLLGEYYYELKHFEKAIECFSWEMELNSTDPLPVKWLSKLYKEIGMANESRDYQQVFLSMQKHA